MAGRNLDNTAKLELALKLRSLFAEKAKEMLKGMTLNQGKLKGVSVGLPIVRDLIVSVYESSLMTSQKDRLKKALSVIDHVQGTIDL